MTSRPAHSHGGAPEQRQAHFRSLAPSQPQSAPNGAMPQTGLGILMNQNNLNSSAPERSPSMLHSMSNMSAEQRILLQEDLADRERQASALAAAGMVADSVNYTRPLGSSQETNNQHQQGLQAPPVLGGGAPPINPEGNEMDGINWNLLDLGTNLDDLDMDFATLFDPANEAASVGMQNQSSGWSPNPQEHQQ